MSGGPPPCSRVRNRRVTFSSSSGRAHLGVEPAVEPGHQPPGFGASRRRFSEQRAVGAGAGLLEIFGNRLDATRDGAVIVDEYRRDARRREREQRRACSAGALFEQLRLAAVFRERDADAPRKRIERKVVKPGHA